MLVFFFNITTYYEIKVMFEGLCSIDPKNSFDYNSYYSNKDFYRDNIIKEFNDLFLKLTIEVIRNSADNNIVNWLRLEKNQGVFLNNLSNQLTNNGISLTEKYQKFADSFKTNLQP